MSEKEQISTLQSIAQARAKYAWECASKNKNKSSDEKEYASLVRKIPMYIKTNGLLNTLAFLYSKSEREKKVLNDIIHWLTNEKWGLIDKNQVNQIKTPNNQYEEKFIEYLLNNADARTMMQYTMEVMALFTWLRRFVKSESDEESV